jgi:hypothetical protein
MRERKRTSSWWPITIVALPLGLLGGYVGAYLNLVQPEPLVMWSGAGPWDLPPNYKRISGEKHEGFWQAVFAPLQSIDAEVRRDKWTTTNPSFIR